MSDRTELPKVRTIIKKGNNERPAPPPPPFTGKPPGARASKKK